MKRIALMIAAAMLPLCLTACGNDTDLVMQVGELKAKVEMLEERVAELEAATGENNDNVQQAQPQSAEESPAAATDETAAIEGFSDIQQVVFETAQSYLTKPYYIKVAKDYNSVQVLHAMELQIADFEGEPFNAVLLQVDADRDIHGFAAGLLVVDMNSMQAYDESMVDLSAIEDNSIDGYEEKIAYLISAYGSCIDGYNDFVIAGHEIRTELSGDELAAINAELTK